MLLNPNELSPLFVMWGTDDLAVFLGGAGDSFTGGLINLYVKADPGNKHRLRLAFPHECRAYEVWRTIDPPTVANMLVALDA